MDGAITIEISEVKILIYLLGLLQIHEKRKTAEILWRKGYGFIRKNLAASLITLLLTFLTRWDIYPLGISLYLHASGFKYSDLSIKSIQSCPL